MVQLLPDLADAGADVRRRRQAAADFVLAEADVAALVLDDPLEDLTGNGIGVLRVAVKDGELQRLENHVLREDRCFPILAGHQLQEPAFEQQQAAAGAPLHLDVRLGNAEIAQAVQEHFQVTAFVRHLGGQENLGEAVRRDGNQTAGAFQRRRLAHTVIAQHRDESVALDIGQ